MLILSLVRWFPSHERASAIGICMGGFHLGNVVGLLLTPIMLSTIGISGPFILFSSLGLLWLSTWISKVTNDRSLILMQSWTLPKSCTSPCVCSSSKLSRPSSMLLGYSYPADTENFKSYKYRYR